MAEPGKLDPPSQCPTDEFMDGITSQRLPSVVGPNDDSTMWIRFLDCVDHRFGDRCISEFHATQMTAPRQLLNLVGDRSADRQVADAGQSPYELPFVVDLVGTNRQVRQERQAAKSG